MIFIILFIFLTILIVLYHLTRGDNDEQLNSNEDPQFNPFNNPFIRVAGKFLNKKRSLDDQPK
jgi:regulatory protein YycI of two-component signal transduction system YycFG